MITSVGLTDVEGFDITELEKKITALEQKFLEMTIGVRDPKSDDVDLLSHLRHRTNNLVDRIVSRPNLRSLFRPLYMARSIQDQTLML